MIELDDDEDARFMGPDLESPVGYVVLALVAEDEEHTGHLAAIGDGETVDEAIESARDWYSGAERCAYCGRCSEGDERIEESWRVFPVDARAYNLVLLIGGYEAACMARELLWFEEFGRFVMPEASCVACRGRGEFREPDGRGGFRRRACDACRGCGCLDHKQLEPGPWIDPPEAAALWRGDRVDLS